MRAGSLPRRSGCSRHEGSVRALSAEPMQRIAVTSLSDCPQFFVVVKVGSGACRRRGFVVGLVLYVISGQMQVGGIKAQCGLCVAQGRLWQSAGRGQAGIRHPPSGVGMRGLLSGTTRSLDLCRSIGLGARLCRPWRSCGLVGSRWMAPCLVGLSRLGKPGRRGRKSVGR
jgi:hypothetical protein